MKHVAVLGSGVVGETLANGLLAQGLTVTRGSRDPGKLAAWVKKSGANAHAATFAEAAEAADTIVLAVKGTAAEKVLQQCGAGNLAGKTIMDTTNPIADEPPQNGVLRYFTNINESLMERLQRAVPKANFVKVFSCVGNAFMVQPDFGGVKPTMFLCGNDEAAKNSVKDILTKFGWDIADMGGAEAARAIEPLAMLWCIPGLRSNSWSHAFKLLRK